MAKNTRKPCAKNKNEARAHPEATRRPKARVRASDPQGMRARAPAKLPHMTNP